MKRKLLIGFTLVFSLIAFNVYSTPTDEVFEKEFQENYQVNEDAKLKVDNKFGDVFLTAWSKNEIKIDVIVKVESDSKRSKVSDFFDDIDVKISGDQNLVEAITHLPKFRNLGNMEISIDYHISLPETIEIDIDQSYGNVVMNNNWVGKTTFDVKYGSLQVRDLNGRDNTIDVQYGEFIAERIENSQIDVAYSEASIESAAKLDLKSSYGEVELGVVGNLDLRTAFDEIDIEEVTDLNARSNFSDFEITKVLNSLEIDMDYGEISIDYVAKDFKLIKIDSDNASVEIEMDEAASYEFEVLTRYGDFYTRNRSSYSEEKLSFKTYQYTGNVGSSPSKGEIFIDSSYASIEIK